MADKELTQISVDIGALRQFQSIWEPILRTIPAVIDMVERRADLDRAMAAYERQVSVVADMREDAETQHAKAVALHAAEVQNMEQQREAWEAELEAFRAAAGEERAACEAQAHAAEAAAHARIGALQQQISELDQVFAGKLAQAQEEFSTAKSVLLAEIKDLEVRKDKAEKSLDALRARLG